MSDLVRRILRSLMTPMRQYRLPADYFNSFSRISQDLAANRADA
jgi:hypothetical protein